MRLQTTPETILTLLSSVHIVTAACECGYQLRDTGARYTHQIYNDFTVSPDVTGLNKNPASASFTRDWTVQSWSAGTSDLIPIPRRNDEANVYIQDGTLVMRQMGYSDADRRANRSVSIAAIQSTGQDFLHGSFRSVFKISDDHGSVGGFFWYHNDTNEIDVEVLTKEPNDTTIHYTSHPFTNPGASYPATLTKPWTEYQEHRFDWHPGNITFYQGARAVHYTTANVPKVAGNMQMNLWANGNEWSGTPSKTNVTMNVKNILFYYNTTASEAGTDQAFNQACSKAGGDSSKTICKDTDPEVKVSGAGVQRSSPTIALLLTMMATFLSYLLAISADLLAKFNLAEQFAAAAYCPSNNNSPGNKLACSSGNCPLVEAANTITFTEFQNSLVTDVTGYVAVDSTNSLIVVAFRGSESVRNYLADANFPATVTDICDGCTADAGFWNSWQEARGGVLAAVNTAIAQNPSFSILSVGHSLGGAIADFAAAEIRKMGHPASLVRFPLLSALPLLSREERYQLTRTYAKYTFGAPRIAGPKLSTFITNQGNNYRITHFDDPVPRLPPIFLNFVHISPEYRITTGNGVPVTTNDVNGPIEGAVNFAGNTHTTAFDLPAHGWYFGNISACYPGDKLEV
ncbi:MAG: hypothetical protein M1835_002113 [Candelina submexicana]|nr:MAG: hypothetical protein M1835_002113 [Candelina submexicana]